MLRPDAPEEQNATTWVRPATKNLALLVRFEFELSLPMKESHRGLSSRGRTVLCYLGLFGGGPFGFDFGRRSVFPYHANGF
jgi:hypothetical protein